MTQDGTSTRQESPTRVERVRRHGLRGEVVGINRALRHPHDGWVTYAVAAAGAVAVVATWVFLHVGRTAQAARDLTYYRADDTVREALYRLPLSVLAPTDHLPLWGAVLLVFAALALAGAVFGWWRALAAGLLAHVLATLVTRLRLAYPWGPHQLNPDLVHAVDTGPSVFFVSLMLFVLVAELWVRVAVIFVVTLALLGVLGGALAASEHLTGMVVGVVLGVAAHVAGNRPSYHRPPPATGPDAA